MVKKPCVWNTNSEQWDHAFLHGQKIGKAVTSKARTATNTSTKCEGVSKRLDAYKTPLTDQDKNTPVLSIA